MPDPATPEPTAPAAPPGRPTPADDVTSLRVPALVPVALAVLVAVLGVGLGFALPPAARWLQALLEQTPLPVHGLVGLLAGLPRGWSVPALGGIGVVAGALVALATVHESLRLEIRADHLEHRREDVEGWVERAEVEAVHRDGKDLVLLGAGGAQLLRVAADDLSAAALRDAFVAHGWPWRDEVLHDDAFVPWLDGRPGFTAAESALLRRRLAERKDAAACLALDRELAEHRLAVRVRDARLQVRRCGPLPGADDDGGPA